MAHLPRRLLAGLLVLSGPALAAPAPPDAAAAPASPPVILANHRAVYDLSLGGSTGSRPVEAARGRIVIDFRGDACRGYTMQTRQVTELTSGETGSRVSDLRSTTFESGQGRDFRFKTTTVSDGSTSAPVDGTATEGDDGLSVKLKGKGKPFTSEGPVLFPSAHMRRLVEAGRAGQATLSVKVYDGSDDGRKVYDTFAVIGPASTGAATGPEGEGDKPLQSGPIAAMRHWPVKLTYYTEGVGERTPIYTLSFDLYENGVSGRIKLDYGDFALNGTMTALDLEADKPAKESDKGCTP
ncbi:cell envelope integrity EipB family protein [Methylobacterium sp. J-076]|uniref:cell envelope integrity EipB family protein n=1 Tax=Methylobacterium sp. J-076 TaxID=2836655 RepID=UPI001FB9080B|nr:cell envelope integrity EipB family protein [Methylobacterium sp. J-076]MCJ2015019.1 cell envelope integrity EipB family protein [Methylobacterium sp. J-076]